MTATSGLNGGSMSGRFARSGKGDSSGVGAIRRFTWSSRLPYSLTFDMRTTIVERPYRLEGEAIGELVGSGRWSLVMAEGGRSLARVLGVRLLANG
jgi:hypothetical protein